MPSPKEEEILMEGVRGGRGKWNSCDLKQKGELFEGRKGTNKRGGEEGGQERKEGNGEKGGREAV